MAQATLKRILIAEDEQAYARALVLKLENAGFEVERVSNGEEALGVLEKKDFDLFLCDLIMPKVNGFQVLERIRDLGLKIPIMILSNLSQESDAKKVLDLGAINFISKSDSTISSVISKIEDFLNKK